MLEKFTIQKYADRGYKYLTQDQDGAWFVYVKEPEDPLRSGKHRKDEWRKQRGDTDFARSVGKTKLHPRWATMLRIVKQGEK